MPAILAVQFPTYQNAMRIVSSITNGFPAAVTTTFAHQYLTGLIVRLYVPRGYGMTQANHLFGSIVVTGDTTFTIDIDTTDFDAFTVPASYPNSYQSAIVVPIGEDNSILTQPTRNVLPYAGI